MGAIFGNVSLVLLILGWLGGGLLTIVVVYCVLFLFVGLAERFEARKTSASEVGKDHDRNLRRQARAGRKLSLTKFKFVDRPSLVDQRTTHQEHH